jgi:hypothetical protein
MRLIAVLLLLALATPALAEPKPRPREKPTRSAPPKRTRTYDFEADVIDSRRVKPDGTTLFGLTAARHRNLIRLRGDFVREIVRSADRL